MASSVAAFHTGSRVGYSAKPISLSVPASAFQPGLLLNFPNDKGTLRWAALASFLVPDEDRLETYASAAMLRYAQAADACGVN